MKNTFLKYIATISCAVLLFPVGVSFSHVLEQHEHKTCDDPFASHFHEDSLDCSLYKFQLNSAVSFDSTSFSTETFIIPQKTNFLHYTSTYSRTVLDISLRGPPKGA